MADGNTEGKVVGESSSSANSAGDSNTEVTKEDLPEIDSLDALQMVLDLAGLVPGLGEGADLLNAAISLGRGDFLGSLFSVVGAIPLLGQGATAAKIAKNADRYTAAVKVVEKKFPWLAQKIKPWLDAVKSKLDDMMGKNTPPGKSSGGDSGGGGGEKSPKGDGDGPDASNGGTVKKSPAEKAEQLKDNKKAGAPREAEVKADLETEGHTVLGEQVTVKTPETHRRIDVLIQDGNTGQIRAIEVKSGSAMRNSSQLAKDAAMENAGATIIGKNAPDALKGQTMKIPTEVRR